MPIISETWFSLCDNGLRCGAIAELTKTHKLPSPTEIAQKLGLQTHSVQPCLVFQPPATSVLPRRQLDSVLDYVKQTGGIPAPGILLDYAVDLDINTKQELIIRCEPRMRFHYLVLCSSGEYKDVTPSEAKTTVVYPLLGVDADQRYTKQHVQRALKDGMSNVEALFDNDIIDQAELVCMARFCLLYEKRQADVVNILLNTSLKTVRRLKLTQQSIKYISWQGANSLSIVRRRKLCIGTGLNELKHGPAITGKLYCQICCISNGPGHRVAKFIE